MYAISVLNFLVFQFTYFPAWHALVKYVIKLFSIRACFVFPIFEYLQVTIYSTCFLVRKFYLLFLILPPNQLSQYKAYLYWINLHLNYVKYL